jgi:TP901 family phage tail tape measure protein
MADINKNVNVIISAQDRFSGAMGTMGGSWGAIATLAIAAEVAILAASVAAAKFAIDMGKEVVGAAVDFHDAIYNVEAVANSFGTTAQDISNILDDLVNRFPVMGAEAGEAMELVAQLGFGAKEELAGMTETALNLSIATGVDLQGAVNLLGATMNAFGLDVNEADRLLNVFAATQFTSAASVGDFNIAIGYLAPTMALNNQSIETAAALFGTLRNNGLEASMAATTVRRAFTQLYKETEKGTAVLASYGLTYEDVNPSTQDFADIIDKLDDRLITAKEATDLFGVRAQIMATIINNGADSFRDYRDTITDTTLGVDAVEKKMAKFETVVNNLGGSMDIMKKTFGIDLVSAITDFIGTSESEGIRLAITKLQELEIQNKQISGVLLETFTNLREYAGDAFKELFPTWEDFYQYVVDVSGALAKNLEILGYFVIEGAAGFVSMTKDTDNLTIALGAVEVAFSLLALPIAAIHDAWAITIGFFRNAFTTVLDIYSWVYEKILSLTLAIQTGLSKLPFSNITDQDLENLRLKLEEVKKANEDAFDIKWPDLWTDNVVGAITEGAGAVIGFGDTYKAVMFKASDDHKALTDSTGKWATTWGEAAKGIQDDWTAMNREMETFNSSVIESSTKLDDSEKMAKELATAVKESTYEMMQFSEEASGVKGGLVEITNEVGRIPGKMDESVSRVDALAASFRTTKDGVLEIGVGLDKVRNDVSLASDGTLIWASSGKEVKSITEQIGTDISNMSKEEVKIFTEQFKADLRLTELTTKQTHELVKANLEWTAKIEIAQLEADSKKAVAAFESIGASVQATADATAQMFGGLVGAFGQGLWPSEMDALFRLVERQLAVQESLAAAQVVLTNEQAEYMRLQNERLKRGDAAVNVQVTVEGDTEGWLAGLMESLFNEIMTKASSEAFNALAQG